MLSNIRYKKIFEKDALIYLCAASISLLFAIFIVPINESFSFVSPSSLPSQIYPTVLKVGFALTLFFVILGIIHFLRQLLQKNTFYVTWLKFSAAYLAFMICCLLLLYPGHWIHDEFFILDAVTGYQPVVWHGILSNIFYTYSLYLFPSAISIIFIQIFIISSIVGWTLATVYQQISRKWLIVFPILLFVTIPVIVNNLYPLRLTLYSYAEFFLILRLLFLLLGYRKVQNLYIDIITMAVLIGIVASWRTEALYYVFIIPLYLYAIDIKQCRFQTKPPVIATLLLSCTIIMFFAYLGSLGNIPKYRLTSTVGTLSNMLRYPLRGEQVEQKLHAIDQVFDINALKQNPSYEEIPVFWTDGSFREGYENHISEYNSAVVYLIIHNFDIYLKVRAYTFLSTNAIGSNYTPMSFGSYVPPAENLPKYIQDFDLKNPFVTPIDLKLKYDATRLLLQTDDAFKPRPTAAFIWTILPTLTTLVAAIFILLLKRKYSLIILLGFLLLHSLIIFATAPANYFMYYFSLYLTGGFIVIILCITHFNRPPVSKTHPLPYSRKSL